MHHIRAHAWLAAGLLLGSVTAAAPASAQTAPESGGGGAYLATPEVTKVTCARDCARRKRIQSGSTIVLRGSDLSTAAEVWFLGSRTTGDDKMAEVIPGSETRVRAVVPVGAATGPVAVATATGTRSEASRPVAIRPAPPPAPSAELTPVPGFSAAGGAALETGTSRTRAFVGARRAVTFSFRLSGPAPTALSVELVQAEDGAVVKTWTPAGVVPGVVESITWNGRLGRAAADSGRYSFRLTAAAADGTEASSAQAGELERDSFDLYDHVFPIRGRHSFGGSAGRFGSGRSGRSHQGQDVFAKCGTPLVAARGGRVQYSGYHAAAGNYIVIDGQATGVDYAYMHLEQPAPFDEGDRVYTGQSLGTVGETGNAQGCHLHFETWEAPGWYEGGDPADPYSLLRAWDRWS